MNLFGFELRVRRKAAVGLSRLDGLDTSRAWWPIVQEPFTGAWQRNHEQWAEPIISNPTLYATVTLIARDMAKLCLRLVQLDDDGIWTEIENTAFSPVLRRPNHYQNPKQFVVAWMLSKLLHGNTYVLKRRDGRGVVNALYVLNPYGVVVLEAPDGSVFYRLQPNALAGLTEASIVPASEIIHDRICPLFHPLIGVAPLFASQSAAFLAGRIQTNADKFFENGSKPGGVVIAPGALSQPQADRIQAQIEKYTGDNVGKILVLTDGMDWKDVAFTAVESQVIEQLRWTDEQIARPYLVPLYKLNIGPQPTYNNIEAQNQQYYTDCLQSYIEEFEACLDQGLGLGPQFGNVYGTEFDIDDLLRMDTATLILSEKNANGLKTVNESRLRLNLPKIEGGDTVYRQQQDFSIEALNRRDQQEGAPPTVPEPPAPPAEDDAKSIRFIAADMLRKSLERVA